MGLFDKKYCDICGEKIGLLGNRKLEDGNLCKDCARKLSPFFSERTPMQISWSLLHLQITIVRRISLTQAQSKRSSNW